MKKEVSIQSKKDFIAWFLSNHSLKHRAANWILNYLKNHEIILNKIHFVENADKSPRGVIMTAKGIDYPDFQFFKDGKIFNNPEQVFHDIRLNWHYDWYIEIAFPNAWQSELYLTVLEDNPYYTWNDAVSEKTEERVNEALDDLSYGVYRNQLLDKIDDALVAGNEEDFNEYSSQLNQLDKTMK